MKHATLQRLRRMGLLLVPVSACTGGAYDTPTITAGSVGGIDTDTDGSSGSGMLDASGGQTEGIDGSGDSSSGGGGECTDGATQACYSGTGTAGMQTCVSGQWSDCEGQVLPVTDICNGLDDDCDGMADEDCECQPQETLDCYTGPVGTNGVGECGEGQQLCVDGSFERTCTGEVHPVPELCNDLDDNCNFQTDEGNPDGGAACETGEQGLCATGTQTCMDGVLGCVPDSGPMGEVCFNGLDENCNGIPDDGCQACPYVFGFDGERWAYETSVGGASVVGRRRHLEAGRGKQVRFRPLWARLDRTRVLADRSVEVEVLAAEDEIVYLDHAALTVVQHPEGHEVVSSSALQWNTLRRKDPRQFWAFRSAALRTPEAARWRGDEDLREQLSQANGEPAAYDRAEHNFYELDFGSVADSRHAWLVVDGWKFKEPRGLPRKLRGQRPRLEVRQADGGWHEALPLATPRGDRKTVAFDLAGIAWPTGRYELRLWTGTHEGGHAMWYLDRVRLTEEPPAPTNRIEQLATRATLAFQGAPTLVDPAAIDRPRECRNDGNGPLLPEQRTFGRFTRYGDVAPLLAEADDRVVVMRRGDAVGLRFEDVPEPPRGWVQTLFLRTTLLYKPRVPAGAKDSSVLTDESGPLPYRGMGRYQAGSSERDDLVHRRYVAEWNTREYRRDDPAWGPPSPQGRTSAPTSEPKARTSSSARGHLAIARMGARAVSRLACVPLAA
jgi:hypothetical protein